MTDPPFRKPPLPPAEGLVRAGGQIGEACVALCIRSDGLDPAEVTTKLGASPTYSCRKGDVHRGENYDRIEHTGKWFLERPTSSEPIDEQVTALLGKLNDDNKVWGELTEEHAVEIIVGVFITDWNQGFDLSAPTLQMLCDRKISIGFDIYSNGNHAGSPESADT